LPPAHLDAKTNDGVVNAVRQLIVPNDASELAALVIADHFDVLGYYDRRQSIAEGGEDDVQVSGLLHSGSFFRDTEFFALYRKVADVIADSCREERSAREEGPASMATKPQPAPKRSRTPSRRPTA
jgi:hypothetical protein